MDDTKRNYHREYILRRKSVRSRIFGHYGWKCECCGEDNEKFLTINHRDNVGYPWSKTGRQRVSMIEMYGKIIKDNYPDAFQTLCYNCNNGKRVNGGVCPHQNV